ncbi:MAG: DUF262 domain-containing protein [Chthoniobacterales bacterium]|nr:DUF262 domain-containing protein [Chthoniobacterales bacterium]
MSETVFKKVDYTLKDLVGYIRMGEIGLPDIQRPFVWKNAKVRDLFDSMYRGYPVGYLLLWQNALTEDAKTIGEESKQKTPRLLIVDGQQRLTSLYAVVRGVSVLREDYTREPIQIAFNPLDEKFEVADAAIQRDAAFITSISVLWAQGAQITKLIREYTERLQATRELSEEEVARIENAILRVYSLDGFPFTALELSPEINEEAVSEVFVRINSKGTPLNQADFILTLMSVFWDQGRTQLERFCRAAKTPGAGEPSPFNHFIKPSPDQLLRVGVGLGFKRARLQYVYSLLRGKDLETGKFSNERRIEQFEVLQQAQARALKLQYWHDFMNCIRQAGFRGEKMISSQNNMLMSYILYLMGRTEFEVDEFRLRGVISRWFFMSSLMGRFTGSPESAMEFDLARFRGMTDADQFVGVLDQICNSAMTDDFWGITLPNDLATSSPRSPSLFAYNAALVLLDAKALFSKLPVAELLDPSIHANRAAVERHHLFPKGYLRTQKITEVRETNQIANFALVEWGDNGDISDKPPAEYLPVMKSRFSMEELARMYHWHALPDGWEHMQYSTFLEKRRDRIAEVIRQGYSTLVADSTAALPGAPVAVARLAAAGESDQIEFKATLRVNQHTGQKDPRMEFAVMKTLAGFLNTNGGRLIIGVRDDGTPLGIEADQFQSEDKMGLHLVNLVNNKMGPQTMTSMHVRFDEYEDRRVMVIECHKSGKPVFLKDADSEHFFIRTGPSTTQLSPTQTLEYIKHKW